jgi:hypothetical protein
MLLMMYSSGSRTEPCTKSASRVCIMRGRERRNSAFSSVSWSRVHITAAAATGLNQFRSVERSVTARSWLPVIVGIPSFLTASQHSFGLAPYPMTSPRQYTVSTSPGMSRRTASSASKFPWMSEITAYI